MLAQTLELYDGHKGHGTSVPGGEIRRSSLLVTSWEPTVKNQDKRLQSPAHCIVLLQSSSSPPLWWMSSSDLPFVKPGHLSDDCYINKLE